MGRFLSSIYEKLREIAAAGDELIGDQAANADASPAEPKLPAQRASSDRLTAAQSPEMTEGVDFYWEGQYMVMTAKYLFKRGYCCETGCRHCPYGFTRENNRDQGSGVEDQES